MYRIVEPLVILFLTIVKVSSVTVTTTLGDLEGSSFFTSSGKEVFTFLAVPYAEPPVGEDRFKEARPVGKWKELRPAMTYPSLCVQLHLSSKEVRGDEDCLYLNIYTTSISNKSTLPVLVFFHGGAFMVGTSAIYRSDYLLSSHDLVFVTVNYRLGPFGFLSTEDEVVPGNNGLKDQTLALKWVRDNIAAFGGDPNKVTISGNSAGAASVHYHYLSPLSRGLFVRGIMSSGSALNPWAFTESPLTKAKVIAEAVNCSTTNNEVMVKCLRQRSATDILSTMPLFMPWWGNPFSPFGPVIEPSNKDAFLSEHPYKLIINGKTFDGPLLISRTTEEGLYPAGMFIDREDRLKILNENWDTIAPHLLDFNYTVSPNKRQDVSEEVRKHYLGGEDFSTNNTMKIIRLVSDRLFDADVNLAARLQASAMESPVYMFTFGYRGNVSFSDRMTRTKANFGVSHLDDLYYILAVAGTTSWMQSDSDQAMIGTLTNIWTNFLETGQPSVKEGIFWQPISRDSFKTGEVTHVVIRGPQDVVLNRTSNLGDYQFWNSLPLQENEHFEVNEANSVIQHNVGRFVVFSILYFTLIIF